jgi:NitT/TauT family transport system permease protein
MDNMALAEVKGPSDVATKPRRRRYTARLVLLATQLGILVVLLTAWQFGVSDAAVPYFSRPSLVAVKLYSVFASGEIYRHIRVTLLEIAIGYSLGALFGLVLGFILGRSVFLSRALQPYIMGFYSVPKIALAPVFIVWLGLGIASKVAVVFLSTFFLVFFNTYSGLITGNEELVRLGRLMGASWAYTIIRVILPGAADQIFLGLKTAVPYAVIGAVIGEYIGSNEGLGFYILYASQTYDAPALFSGIIVLVVMVFIASCCLNWVERHLIRWRKAGRGQTVQL